MSGRFPSWILWDPKCVSVVGLEIFVLLFFHYFFFKFHLILYFCVLIKTKQISQIKKILLPVHLLLLIQGCNLVQLVFVFFEENVSVFLPLVSSFELPHVM